MEAVITITSRQIARGNQTETVSARDLWTFLGSKQDFNTWLFSRLDKYKLVADEDYTIERATRTIQGPSGPENRVFVEYHLTIEAAKQLSMVESNEKGAQVRKYFIECERRAKEAAIQAASRANEQSIDPMRVLSDPAALRSMLLGYTEQLLTAQATIAAQTPKVAALARIAVATQGSLCMTDAAKALQIGPREFIQWLQSNGWIYRRSGTFWLAYQTQLRDGLLEHKIFTAKARNDDDKIVSQVRVTAKGLTHLAELFAASPSPVVHANAAREMQTQASPSQMAQSHAGV